MKTKLNLTISREVAGEARVLGVNMSRVAEAANAEASRAERNRRWVAENRAALDAYADEVAHEGLPLAAHRLFKPQRSSTSTAWRRVRSSSTWRPT